MDKFLVGPANSGLQTNLKPFLIADDAFALLQNAYTFRGRIRKRFGSKWTGTTQYTSRARILLTTTTGGTASGTVPGNQFNIGQTFTIGSNIFTVYQNGTMLINGTASTATFNTTTGAFAFTGVGAPDNTAVFWYPASPILGITQYQSGTINNHPTYVFDEQFAYQFTGQGWSRSGTAEWHGSNLNYYYNSNWRDVLSDEITLFSSNFNATSSSTVPGPAVTDDPIWTMYPKDTWTAAIGGTPQGFYFLPNPTNASPLPPYRGPFIQSALLMIPFHNRLIFLNTVENDNTYAWQTSLGTPISGSFNGTIPNGFAFVGQQIFVGATTFQVNSLGTAVTLTLIAGSGSGTINTNTGAFTLSGVPNSPVFVNGVGMVLNYPQRVRFSINGNPFAQNAWYEQGQQDNTGTSSPVTGAAAGAGFIDFPSEEEIVSVGFIKDRLIVQLERSHWEIAWTGSEVEPFVINRINAELGSMGTYTTVLFDKALLTIGQTGITGCTGANVTRIDNDIPSQVFDTFDTGNNGAARIQGIRDYFTELVYWTFVDDESLKSKGAIYPNQVLAYNYANRTWAMFDDCITAFGYFEQQTNAETWETSFPKTWATYQGTWSSSMQDADQRLILGGNPEGFLFIIDPDQARNVAGLQITNIVWNNNNTATLTIFDHTLSDQNSPSSPSGNGQDYILIENMASTDPWFPILNGKTFKVYFVQDANTIRISIGNIPNPGAYLGGGTVARVSNVQILSKMYNPYIKEDKNVFIQKIDFCVLRVPSSLSNNQGTRAQITVDYYGSATTISAVETGSRTGALMGTCILETSPYDSLLAPLEQFQQFLWHPVHLQTVGSFIQLSLYWSEKQMLDPYVPLQTLEIESFIICANRSGRLQ